ncbi:M15 family metallopeptidase [Shewanella sp.]|nr:M15 family metallopeptidase [Shewanella sp.]
MLISAPHLYGLSRAHLVEYGDVLLEKQTALAFKTMQIAALDAGINLQICSGFRDFKRQTMIWNAKANGSRPLLDHNGKPVNITDKTPEQIIELILLWSALPGTSRHHWGTDLDIFDCHRISKAQLALIPDEYRENGPCAHLHAWLKEHAIEYGFYFPYQPDLSGVSAEPWHLSYFPVAKEFIDKFEVNALASILKNSSVLHKEILLSHLDSLVQEYVFRVAPIP